MICKVLYKLIFYIILWPQIFKAEKRIKPCEAIKKFHTRTIFNCMDFLRKSGKLYTSFSISNNRCNLLLFGNTQFGFYISI